MPVFIVMNHNIFSVSLVKCAVVFTVNDVKAKIKNISQDCVHQGEEPCIATPQKLLSPF